MTLNDAAHAIGDEIVARAAALGVRVETVGGVRVIDCGVRAAGSHEAGLLVAQAAMARLGDVTLVPADDPGPLDEVWPACRWPVVTESTAEPVAACLASQYAGWKVEADDFFAMASGPMRAAIGRERLFDTIGMRERPAVAVGLLEASRLPPAPVCVQLAADAGVDPGNLTLLVARTASPAGALQVTARALETALHKLHDLGFDVTRIRSGRGSAPLPPVPPDDDLRAIGRTNDAILYGGYVTLAVDGPEADLAAIGPRVVSEASPAHGEPFLRVFEKAGRDFYAIDPAIFAPARVDLVSIETGRTHRFGRCEPDVIERSFSG